MKFLREWLQKQKCFWKNLCPRCETKLVISHYSNGMTVYDDSIPEYECPFCSNQTPEFLELFDLLKAGTM